MGLQLGLFLSQGMKQELRMTPQLQQAIKLLVLSRVELIEEIQHELSSNPLLEEVEGGQDSFESSADQSTEYEPHTGLEDARDQDDGRDRDDLDAGEWERYLDELPTSSDEMPYQHTEELPSIDVTYSRRESLSEHLIWQLEVSQFSSKLLSITKYLITYLNDHGYLCAPPFEEIAQTLEVTVEQVEEALAVLQELDPIGVGARDLRECLLIQAEFYQADSLLKQVIDQHLPDLERRRYAQIARAQGVDIEEIYKVTERIRNFEPYPGNAFTSEDPQYVVPDLRVIYEDGEYRVQTNDEGLPKLKINHYYRRLIRQSKDQEAKQYVTERLNAARALIKSVDQRKQTIVRVMECIIKHQKAFFEQGPEFLKPLVLKTIADDLELHESTISRVTTNKYVQTPRGLYDFKFFFNSMIQGSGEQTDLASEAVKTKIKRLISEEDPRKPLSDQVITQKLEETGLNIARRTVAKYRESLGILSSSQRKQHF